VAHLGDRALCCSRAHLTRPQRCLGWCRVSRSGRTGFWPRWARDWMCAA
jgi:hypothetical protein